MKNLLKNISETFIRLALNFLLFYPPLASFNPGAAIMIASIAPSITRATLRLPIVLNLLYSQVGVAISIIIYAKITGTTELLSLSTMLNLSMIHILPSAVFILILRNSTKD